jgi:hypothetical protein
MMLLGTLPVAAQLKLAAQLNKVMPATVAAHMAGRLAGVPNGDVEIIGYITYVEGIGGNVFAGAPSEKTSLISFRTDLCRLNTIPNGGALEVSRQIPPSGEPSHTRLYYDPAPARDFDNPETFSTGQLIAVLRAHPYQGILVPGQMFHVAGSMDLEESSDLMLGDLSINLRKLGRAVTVTFAGAPPSAAEFAAARSISVPLSGTIIASRPAKTGNG